MSLLLAKNHFKFGGLIDNGGAVSICLIGVRL
jgi:hypothetical protein